ncbi:MAG TPA: hypothetical protein VJZ91_05460 [Blastocatellia bacterium]|nr:hypothetical protein [Blastocatellia bacterium]
MMDEKQVQDTDPEARRVLIELARRTPVWKKFAQVAATTETCRAFAKAGIRRRYPDAGEDEIKRRLAAVVLDRETVIKVYGWDPKTEGY